MLTRYEKNKIEDLIHSFQNRCLVSGVAGGVVNFLHQDTESLNNELLAITEFRICDYFLKECKTKHTQYKHINTYMDFFEHFGAAVSKAYLIAQEKRSIKNPKTIDEIHKAIDEESLLMEQITDAEKSEFQQKKIGGDDTDGFRKRWNEFLQFPMVDHAIKYLCKDDGTVGYINMDVDISNMPKVSSYWASDYWKMLDEKYQYPIELQTLFQYTLFSLIKKA